MSKLLDWLNNSKTPQAAAALGAGLLTAACSTTPQEATMQNDTANNEPFRVQVVGVQWMNPLQRRDYPTEWQLLWTLGLAKPNKNDELVKEDPKMFTTLQPIAGLAFNMGKQTFEGFFERYLEKMFKPFGNPYAMDPKYFYTVKDRNDPKKWRELHGIHVQMAVPNTPKLPVDKANLITRNALMSEFEFATVPALSTAKIPADVHITAGGASAGFTSLNAAMDYLQANPSKSAWVMNWDAPDFPKDEQMTENCALLILAGPKMNTERNALAWISRPVIKKASEFDHKDGMTRMQQAWVATFEEASAKANLKPQDFGQVIHDVGAPSQESSDWGSNFYYALTMKQPEKNPIKDFFNTPRVLGGHLGAGTAVTNMALGVAWAHHQGTPVLVAGTNDLDRASAVVITPPEHPRVMDPNRDWFRARGENNAYLPWWGLRKDANEKDSFLLRYQGYSE